MSVTARNVSRSIDVFDEGTQVKGEIGSGVNADLTVLGAVLISNRMEMGVGLKRLLILRADLYMWVRLNRRDRQ